MKRRLATIAMAGFLACVSVHNSYAVFSKFARITPETQEKHHVYVQILPVQGEKGKCKIIPPKVHQGMNTYLITCRERIPAKEQNFRGYIWRRDWDRPDILSVAPLLPYGMEKYSNPSHVVRPMPNHVILDRSLLKRSYIYIDYPTPVLDGGYFYCIDLSTYPLPEERKLRVRYSPAQGLGPEQGVMRRDPSDIIKVGDLYYVWYTKSHVPHGYDATVWYATSPDGHAWTEQGEALPRGPKGSWDEQSVFTPNILKTESEYYLYYTGVPKPFHNKGNQVTKTAIGMAVADSPDGPWEKVSTNPVLSCIERTTRFDSMRVDDACLLVRDGKYWLYYKGRRWNDTPAHTEMGLAVADAPEGPYTRYVANPVVKGGHEVLAWPLGAGVAAMVNIGPEGVRKTLRYAPDGLTFSRMMDLDEVPNGPGASRPEAFTDSGRGRMIEWGLHIRRKEGFLPFLERFDCQWDVAKRQERPEKSP